jgi:hypothetical protein
MNEVYTGYHWIVAVAGVATDIRGDAGLAIRQGKVRKACNPDSDVTLHYGSADCRTYHNDKGLVVEIRAELSDSTLMARVAS